MYIQFDSEMQYMSVHVEYISLITEDTLTGFSRISASFPSHVFNIPGLACETTSPATVLMSQGVLLMCSTSPVTVLMSQGVLLMCRNFCGMFCSVPHTKMRNVDCAVFF